MLGPILIYAALMWRHAANTNRLKSEVSQKYLLRVITNARCCVNKQTIHSDLDIKTVYIFVDKLQKVPPFLGIAETNIPNLTIELMASLIVTEL